MRVLGIDPGLGTTGYGIIDDSAGKLKLVEAGEIKSKSSMALECRLFDLYTSLSDVVQEFHPDVFAIEELYAHYKHPRTAVIMGHARGVLFLVAGIAHIPVYSYSATRIKKSLTGRGHAGKEQVARMVCSSLGCSEIVDRPDVTDALAAALCHINVIDHGGA